MPRPQISVTVATAPPRLNPGALTSRTFLTYAATTGPSVPTLVRSAKEASDAGTTADAQQMVVDLFNEGADTIVLNRVNVAAAALATTDAPTLLAALNTVPVSTFGVGQVIIPGLSTAAAYSALLDHAKASGRTVLMDTAAAPTAASLLSATSALRARQGAERAAVIAGSVLAPVTGGTTRVVPGSIVAAGAASRMDARVGHAGRAVAFTQEFGDAGLSYVGTSGATATFSDTDLDSLADAGITPIINRPAGATIYDWLSISSDSSWAQLNYGRTAMQVAASAAAYLEQFLGRPIDGTGQLFASIESGLAGQVFAPLWRAGAFYGATAGDAFEVAVAAVTTAAEIAAGTVHAAVAVAFTPAARKVQFDVTISKPGAVTL